MAATFNESQKIDYLWKKVGYGVTKTAEVTTKEAFNESIASPLLYRGDLVWMQSDQITNTPPASTNTIVQVYKDGVGSFSPSVECTEDLTAPDNQTWKTNLTNWVPTQFGDNYLIQVYVANSGVTNPQTSGTKLFQAGSGSDDTWFFDYQSGVLNFNGATIPTQITGGITGKSVYIVGYRYVGLLGVTNLPSNTSIGNLNFTGTTISSTTTNGNIIIAPNGTGTVQISSAVTANGNITANFYIGNGSLLTGVAASNAVSAGTVTDNAQPNITSVGTLISLNVSGNITAGNILGTLANGNSNVNIPNANGNINLTAVGNTTMVITGTGVNVSGTLTATGNLTLVDSNVTGANVVSANTVSANLLATTSNVTGNSITNNLTVNLALSGNTANFTGNIITLNANLGNAASANYFIGNGSLLTGVAASNAVSAGTVTNNAQPNITSVGTLISLDITGNLIAGNANLGNLVIANYFSGSGNLLSNIQGSNVTGNVTSAVTANFANYAGNVTLSTQPNITSVGTLVSLDVTGNVTAGNISGANVISSNLYTGTLTTNAQPNITSVGTLTSLSITGNISSGNANLGNLATANFFSGSGANLTNIPAGNISGQVANALVAGTVYTNAQPNITSVGTLTSLSVTGNISSGNANLGNLVIANFFSGSGNLLSNIQGSNVTGNVTSAVTANFANYAGNVTLSTQPNITSVGTLVSLDVTGNVTTGNITAGVGSGGSITGANLVSANYFIGNFYGTANSATTAGTVTTNAQPNITSVGTLTSLAVTGNISSGNANLGNLVTANFFSGSGNNLSNIQGSNVTGNVTSAVTANFANYAGNVTVASQSNITSVGTLTSLTVSGHLTANTFQMGYGIYAFYSTSVFFATTASTASNQLLWDYPAADLSAIDFTIIATDSIGATRQSCKISAAILGTTVAYSEYGGLFINGGVGSFSVIYNGSGPTPTLELVVTPDSSNLTEYNMLISKYLV